MKCPYCNKQMVHGFIRYDSRSGLRWHADGDTSSKWDKFCDALGGIGQLTAALEDNWAKGNIPGDYCPGCKKMLIETDIVR